MIPSGENADWPGADTVVAVHQRETFPSRLSGKTTGMQKRVMAVGV